MKAADYRPHPLLRNGHLQTMMVGLHCGIRPSYNAQMIDVELVDGECLQVHEEKGGPVADKAAVVILVHGLGGDHASPYLQRIAHRLRQYGQRVWRLDLRGHGAGLTKACLPAHAGASSDLAAVYCKAAVTYTRAPIRLVGFSLSGNILLKFLGELAAGKYDCLPMQRLEHALAVAPPVNLHACANNMDRVSRSLYSHYYLRALDRQVQQRRRMWSRWEAIPTQPRPKSIRQFDARYTAPLSGFKSVDDYYTLASATDWLSSIVTPTMVLLDQHDPIVTIDSFDHLAWNSTSTQIEVSRFGGHMGYFTRDPEGGISRWIEDYVVHRMRMQAS